METQKAFGRRVRPQFKVQPEPDPERLTTKSLLEVPSNPPAPSVRQLISRQTDDELKNWKQARRQNYRMPWRQLSFLATLFFGIASLALSDTVNENVQWVLYALMAASLISGFTARRRKLGA